jgi:phytoene synthase
MTVSSLAELVRQHDPDRFLASLFAPASQREAVWVLCAFNHEVARAREAASEPMLALIRLQWWREVVLGARRRHEVAGPLGAMIDAGVLHQPDLLAMIDAREIEADDTMPDRAAWERYLLGGAGGLAVAIGRVLGASEAELERLRCLGAAYGVAGSVLNVTALARQGRCLLPDDALGAQGLTRDHVLRDPSCTTPVLSMLAEQGRIWLQAGGGRYAGGVVVAGLPAVLARRDLRRMARRRLLGDRLAVVRSGLLGRI